MELTKIVPAASPASAEDIKQLLAASGLTIDDAMAEGLLARLDAGHAGALQASAIHIDA